MNKSLAVKSCVISLLALLWLYTGESHAASRLSVGAEHGMVVSAHRLATKVGVDVLAHGGNAVDAAVAVGYALAVTFPEAGNLGGGGFMLVRFKDGHTTFINFRETAPGAATATMYQDAQGNIVPNLSTYGYLSAGIPGTPAGLELALTKYGTRPRAELMAPAIKLARQGFVLDQGDADMLAEGAEDFRKDAPTAAIFLNHGAPFKPGQKLVQKDLANSLEAIATSGLDAFYRGDIAKRIVDASAKHGGIMALSDFAAYKAQELQPLSCDYRGYKVYSSPPPSSGGMVICESLNILEAYPIAELGFHSAQGTHYLIEAWRRAYHDRNLNLGDPDFVKFDVRHFIDKAYAEMQRAGISANHATASNALPGPAPSHEGANTTHYSIVDAQGNAVSVTYTLNNWFGARVTPSDTGILLNDEMDDFSSKPGAPNMFGLVEGTNNAIAPGKRPLSSMTPTIVTKDDQLFMVVGTPGGSRIPTGVMQVVMNVIDYGMELQEEVDVPRLHQQWMPDITFYEHNALSADTMKNLDGMGQKLKEMRYGNHIAAILVGTPGIGRPPLGKNHLYGAIDPRLSLGSAEGY